MLKHAGIRSACAAGAFWRGTALCAAVAGLVACAPADYRTQADEVAYDIIEQKQAEAIGRTEPFTIERPAETLRRKLLGQQDLPVSGAASYGSDALEPIEHQPEEDYPRPIAEPNPALGTLGEGGSGEPVRLSLAEALRVAAYNSREYQSQKESVFRAALDLDLEIDEFRNTYAGLLESLLSTNQAGDTVSGLENSATFDLTRRLESGGTLSARLALDLAQLLSSNRASATGIAMDFSATIPLLRGAGRHIVTEPLTQAERNVIYAIWGFERFKRTFIVDVVSDYYDVLQAQDEVRNAEASYRNQIVNTRRTRALADEGRIRQEDLDQARSQELRVRGSWIRAQLGYETALDRLNITLGLPTDARIEIDRGELDRLYEAAAGRLNVQIPEPSQDEMAFIPPADAPVDLEPPDREAGGPYELPEPRAVRLALEHRLDLRTAHGQVYDAQRGVVVAADALQAGLTLTGDASAGGRRSLGSVNGDDAELRFTQGFYSAGLLLDLPWERTAERNLYRDSYIRLEQVVRSAQDLEDRIKLQVRDELRSLLQLRDGYVTQVVAERVAERRVDRTRAFLELGRANVSARDVNEAQAELLSAQNAVTSALISYRIQELAIQRDMGVLTVNHEGIYDEYDVSQVQ